MLGSREMSGVFRVSVLWFELISIFDLRRENNFEKKPPLWVGDFFCLGSVLLCGVGGKRLFNGDWSGVRIMIN